MADDPLAPLEAAARAFQQTTSAAMADAEEEGFRLSGGAGEPTLFMRHLPPGRGGPGRGRPVLYVHGATFPSGLAVGFRFDGRSWMDELSAAGFDVWGFDFAGYGESDRYPEMAGGVPGDGEPLGRAPTAARQVERAVRFAAERNGAERVSLIAHSWGTIAAGLFATRHPGLVDRLVFFGPIARRAGPPGPQLGAWRYLTLAEQHKRFVEDVPPGHPPVLLDRHFAPWGSAYLATDPTSGTRTPPSVRTPNGPIADILAAWSGELAYDPALIRAPVAIIRGEWDSLTTDADARWLFDALRASPAKRDVKIAGATHLMHLEEGRYALYREAEAFLRGCDTPPEHAHALTTASPENRQRRGLSWQSGDCPDKPPG